MTIAKHPCICNFCFGNHNCRNCPIEAKFSPILKKIIGPRIEFFVSKNISCPFCNKKTLYCLDDNSPSLDLVCKSCQNQFEVKSKCLSAKNLPKDIILPHGNYYKYKQRQESILNLIVVIYKVDRIKKEVEIREVLFASHNSISKKDNIFVNPRNINSLIQIKDRNKLNKFKLNKKFNFNFKQELINFRLFNL
jgi:hypothetical protein